MVRAGRPRLCSDGLLRRVLAMRNEGVSYQRICDTLNAEGVPTPAGRPRWCRSHVSRLVYTRSARELRLANPPVSGSPGSSRAD